MADRVVTNLFANNRGAFPRSHTQLRRGLGTKDPLFHFLKHLAEHDAVHFFDDFTGDTLPADYWLVAGGGGASQSNFAINVTEDGWIRATTGTGNGDTTTSTIIGPKIYYGDRFAGIEIRFSPITAVTETRIELGFVDVVPGSTKSVVNSLTTPSVNTSVADAALYVYDHTGTTTTNELVTIGTSITAAKTTFTPPTAIAAATKYTVRLQVYTNFVELWMDGVSVARHVASGTDYIEGGNGLAPFALIRASNATSKSLDLDYVSTWKERN